MLDGLEALIRESRTFDLAQPMQNGMPVFPAHAPYCFSLNKTHGEDPYPGGVSFANDIVFTSSHCGTHIDAICHFSRDGKFYKGLDALENQNGKKGFAVYGIETTPTVLRRCVLLDVASYKDTDVLESGYSIGGTELEKTARMEDVDIRRGDVVFVRTGWARHWNDPVKFLNVGPGTPGPDVDGALWLLEKGASLVGGDTAAFERSQRQGAVHTLLLVENGIQIVENLNLEELARERIYSFLLFIAPLKIVGATGSPITPVAICA